ncbi:MFS transporter [Bifidobacterium thermacidophilum]|uniref:MFS transporter n=1 Tax=Bifidobacterium thermacidophilum TaxID=246618 RepID=UPI000424D89E|nr:MFS transporter [Bifidobacterium thermacidophilum]
MTENATSAAVKQGSMKYVVILALSAGMAGLLYGYDTVSISGAIEFLRQAYHLSAGLQGLVISSIMIGGVVGVGFSGFLADKIGRRKVLLIGAPASSSQHCGPPSPSARGP